MRGISKDRGEVYSIKTRIVALKNLLILFQPEDTKPVSSG